MKRIKPDPLSFRSLYVETRFGDEVLGRASAFAWKRPKDCLLFTNWHVVSGMHPETRQPLSKGGSTPDTLTVWLRRNTENAFWVPLTIALSDKQGRPIWLEHPYYRSNVGVYSGRLPGMDEFEAQLGFVWKSSLVEDIASNGIRPD
jgi:hypothetical protein